MRFPRSFATCLGEPAFDVDEMTFCMWRRYGDTSWNLGPIEFPRERCESIGAVERDFSSPTRSSIIVVSRPTRRTGNDHAQAQAQPTAKVSGDPPVTAGSPRGDPGRDP